MSTGTPEAPLEGVGRVQRKRYSTSAQSSGSGKEAPSNSGQHPGNRGKPAAVAWFLDQAEAAGDSSGAVEIHSDREYEYAGGER